MSGKPGPSSAGNGGPGGSQGGASGSGDKPPLSKKDERRLRNLHSANVSRQRRREMISSLTEEKARLQEANALLRARLNIAPGILPPLVPLEGGSASGSDDVAQLGPAMQELLKRKTIDGKAAVDLLDRALSGGRGKDPPVDPDAAAKFRAAAKKAPKDVKRPVKYYTGEPVKKGAAAKGSGSGKASASGKGSASGKASGSKGKGKR